MKIIGRQGKSFGLKVRSPSHAGSESFHGVTPLPLNTSPVSGSKPGSKNPLPGGVSRHENEGEVGGEVRGGAGRGVLREDTLCVCGHGPEDHVSVGCLHGWSRRGDRGCGCGRYQVNPDLRELRGAVLAVTALQDYADRRRQRELVSEAERAVGDIKLREVAPSGVRPYEPPVITPVGNMFDLLASVPSCNGGES